ncbi:MAG: hypothetical protein WCK77_10740 [Verrucomicrobiota bacterium]
MFRYAIRGLCLAACVSAAHGQRVADFTAALGLAKASKANIAVFVHGSDWNRPGEAAAKVWNNPRFLSALGAGVLLLDMDRKENPTAADAALAKLNEPGNPQLRSIPAIALYDCGGRLVGSYAGTAEIDAAGGLLSATKKLAVTCRERDQVWQIASGSSGVMKAARLGQGLDGMNIGLGPKDVYKPVLEDIRKADPEDKSGYIGKYTFSSDALVGLAIDKAEHKQFEEADKEFAKWDANPRLSPRQRQELQAARFALYQRWPAKKQDCKPLLKKMRDIDPKSELGRAAATYLDMLYPASKKAGTPT